MCKSVNQAHVGVFVLFVVKNIYIYMLRFCVVASVFVVLVVVCACCCLFSIQFTYMYTYVFMYSTPNNLCTII